jgi:succinyl-CoA synthetase beta subunit
MTPDAGSDLDLVTIFSAEGIEAEMEAVGIQSVLESAGITAVLVGSSSLPNLPFAVQVASAHADEALRVLAEAQAAGPAAAEAAEAAGERAALNRPEGD